MEQNYCEVYSQVIEALQEGMAEAQESVIKARGELHYKLSVPLEEAIKSIVDDDEVRLACECEDCRKHGAWIIIMERYASIMDNTLYALKHLEIEHEVRVTCSNATIETPRRRFDDDPFDGGCPADTR